MDAKEKAKELALKFHEDDLLFDTLSWNEAKQCALIAVDEMIMQNGELFLLPLHAEIIEHYKKTNSYLFEVKDEINKL
jgi:hypothetical protein